MKCIFALLLLPALVFSQTKKVKLTHDATSKKVEVLVDTQPFTAYIYPDQDVLKKPVLYPVRTAQGTLITRGWPFDPRPGERVDHPHHVGVWFNHGDVNGHDFWNNSNDVDSQKGTYGTIVHTGIKSMKSGKKGTLVVTADWLDKNGGVLLKEETTFTFQGTDTQRLIDRKTTLTAVTDVKFTDNKEGMFAIRLARELEHPSDKPDTFLDANGIATKVSKMDNSGVTGVYRNDSGVEGGDVWSKRSKWMNLRGKIGNETISLAMFDHPQNPNYPSHWHARGYGLYAVNNIGSSVFANGKEGKSDVELSQGESLTFNYRLVVTSGEVSDAEMDKLRTFGK